MQLKKIIFFLSLHMFPTGPHGSKGYLIRVTPNGNGHWKKAEEFSFQRKAIVYILKVSNDSISIKILTHYPHWKDDSLISSLTEKLICTILHTLSSQIHFGGIFLSEENGSHLIRKRISRYFILSSKNSHSSGLFFAKVFTTLSECWVD